MRAQDTKVSERNGKGEATCHVVAKQAWSGLIRDACSFCDVTVPAEATRCPACGRRILGRG